MGHPVDTNTITITGNTSVSVDLNTFARSTNMKFFVDENHVKVGFLRSAYDTESFLLRADASNSTWNVYCCQDGKLRFQQNIKNNKMQNIPS